VVETLGGVRPGESLTESKLPTGIASPPAIAQGSSEQISFDVVCQTPVAAQARPAHDSCRPQFGVHEHRCPLLVCRSSGCCVLLLLFGNLGRFVAPSHLSELPR
jgi:hypothetical protein